jgi:hypothetical protein
VSYAAANQSETLVMLTRMYGPKGWEIRMYCSGVASKRQLPREVRRSLEALKTRTGGDEDVPEPSDETPSEHDATALSRTIGSNDFSIAVTVAEAESTNTGPVPFKLDTSCQPDVAGLPTLTDTMSGPRNMPTQGAMTGVGSGTAWTMYCRETLRSIPPSSV